MVRRYDALWHELTSEELLTPDEQRWRIGERVRRLNELGFDVDEMELVHADGGSRLKLRTRVAETGHHRRVLFARTGLDAQENQARRLLADIASFRCYLEQLAGHQVPESVAANRWLVEVYEPALAAVPAELRGRLDDPEIFHGILEHRWFLSEHGRPGHRHDRGRRRTTSGTCSRPCWTSSPTRSAPSLPCSRGRAVTQLGRQAGSIGTS